MPAAFRAPLIGRSHEMDAVTHFLAHPAPQVLMFAGEPGIGKSRVLEEAAHRARAAGFTVLEGGAHGRSGQEPYAPLLDTLSRSLASSSPRQLKASLSGCGWLARLLPELVDLVGAPLPTVDLPADQERRLVFAAVARYLANLAGAAGTLLVLDDLQWSSRDGLDLLSSLLVDGTGAPVRVIGAYRETEVGPGHSLSSMLAHLAERNSAEHMLIDPLTIEEEGQLLDAILPPTGSLPRNALREEIAERSGGLPFFLVSYVQSLADFSEGNRPSVPWNVAQSVRQRVASLPDAGQRVLEAAAVAGRTVERRVLLGMGLGTEEEVLSGLDAACRARLLVVESDRRFRFAHDVIREVVEADLGPGRRALLHGAAGQALERMPHRPGRAAQLTWHFSEAEMPEPALRSSLLAGDEAMSVSARGEAEEHYRAAVALAEEVVDLERQAEAWEKLGLVLRSSGRYDEAFDALEQAANIQHAAGRLEEEGRILTKMGWVLSQQGKPDEGITRLRAMAGQLEQSGPSAALVGLYETLYHLYSRQGREDEALAAAEQAAHVSGLVDDAAVRLRGEVDRGRALSARDHFDDALDIFARVIPAAEQMGDSDMLAAALFGAAGITMAQGDFERSWAYRIQLVELRTRTHGPEYVAWALAWVAEWHFLRGDWAEARSDYERAAELTSHLDSHQAGWVRIALAELEIAEGKWVDAERYLHEAADVVQRSVDRQSVPRVEAMWASLDLLRGEAGAALARLEPLAGTFELLPDERAVLAEAYLGVGNTHAANDAVERGSRRAAAQNSQLDLCNWLRLEGMVRAAQGRRHHAERALSEAASLASRLPLPYGHARALYERGRICLERGETERAREHLREAHVVFQQLGAEPYAERTRQLLG